jgi:nicotinamide-nucleotide amidase
MVTVEIIVTGNEVLLGDVLDTNTNWMCKRITAFGGRVERAVIVRDEMDAIVREVRSSLERSVRLIVTIGGMGPTWDDMTVAAVAHAVHRPLLLHPQALAIVRQRYEHFAREGAVNDPAITPNARKWRICLKAHIRSTIRLAQRRAWCSTWNPPRSSVFLASRQN